MSGFDKLVSLDIAKTLKAMQITTPTEIQKAAMPQAILGHDIIAQAPTGTGKTLAYLLPAIAQLEPKLESGLGHKSKLEPKLESGLGHKSKLEPNSAIKGARIIILAPTYELCVQIAKVAQGLIHRDDVALLIGRASKKRQLEILKKKPKIIVGSPGRVLELVQEKKLAMHNVRTLIFDEADKLFHDDNMNVIKGIIKPTLKHQRQIMLFSAKITDKALALATPLMKRPKVIIVSSSQAATHQSGKAAARQLGKAAIHQSGPAKAATMPQGISHYYILASPREKFDTLRKLLHAQGTPATMVFVNIPFTIEKIAARLNHHKLETKALYGLAKKQMRQLALEAFRAKRVKILVTSDIASRGLDISGLDTIVNLDMPDNENDYLHRAGRCGRLGTSGQVFSIVTPGQAAALNSFAKKLGIDIAQKTIKHGKLL